MLTLTLMLLAGASTPATIAATNKTSGLSRPLCPYPQYARSQGVGRPERRRQLGVHGALSLQSRAKHQDRRQHVG